MIRYVINYFSSTQDGLVHSLIFYYGTLLRYYYIFSATQPCILHFEVCDFSGHSSYAGYSPSMELFGFFLHQKKVLKLSVFCLGAAVVYMAFVFLRTALSLLFVSLHLGVFFVLLFFLLFSLFFVLPLFVLLLFVLLFVLLLCTLRV